MANKYLILGGNGVFGVNLTQYLQKQDPSCFVISVGRNLEKSDAFTLSRGIDKKRYAYKQVHMVFEPDRLFDLLEAEKPDYIINFAALAADVQSSWKYSTRFYDTNVVALARLTDWLIGKSWLKRFVQIGSSEIFGAVTKPSNELTPPNPTTPYAISKLAGDYHLKAICKIREFPMNILWPSNAYAPGQQLYRIIPRTVLACMFGRQLPLQGGGKAVKSYLHADDLSSAIYLTMHKADVGQCYTVGPDNGISIRDLVYKTIEKFDMDPSKVVKIAPDRLGQDAAYLIDSTKIKTDLNWKQEVSLDKGLDTMIAWAKEYQSELEPLSTEVFFQA